MSKEVVPDLNDFTLNPGEVARHRIPRARARHCGCTQGNSPRSQVDIVTVGKKQH